MSVSVKQFVNHYTSTTSTLDRKIELAKEWANIEKSAAQERLSGIPLLDEQFRIDTVAGLHIVRLMEVDHMELERAVDALKAPYVPEEGNLVTLVGVTCIAILIAIIIWF